MVKIQKILEDKGPEKTFEMVREAARDYVYDLRKKGEISFSEPRAGEIPSIHIIGETIPETWEKTTMALMGIGTEVHTHYDPGFEKGEFASFPSLEASTETHILNPLGEPFLHRFFLGAQFGDYQAEMEGIKDHWVLDPKEVAHKIKQGLFEEIKGHTGWLYSYSQRLRNYPHIDSEGNNQTINQLDSIVTNLTRNPLSKSAEAITWDPRFDHNDGQMGWTDFAGERHNAIFKEYHAPCFQRLWVRLMPFEGGYKMNSNTHWRSRCHLKAKPSNIYGMEKGIIAPLREKLAESLGAPIYEGRTVEQIDSDHVYGHYLDPRHQGADAETALQLIFNIAEGQPLEERVFHPGTTQHQAMTEMFQEEYEERMKNPDKGRFIK